MSVQTGFMHPKRPFLSLDTTNLIPAAISGIQCMVSQRMLTEQALSQIKIALVKRGDRTWVGQSSYRQAQPQLPKKHIGVHGTSGDYCLIVQSAASRGAASGASSFFHTVAKRDIRRCRWRGQGRARDSGWSRMYDGQSKFEIRRSLVGWRRQESIGKQAVERLSRTSKFLPKGLATAYKWFIALWHWRRPNWE